MLYLIYFAIPTEVGNRIDFEEGGPGPVIGYMMSRFKPQAAYAEAGTSNVLMVADLDEAKMTELGLFVRKKFDITPQFTPLIPAEAILELAGKAIEAVKQAP
jgi:hypothetical protein